MTGSLRYDVKLRLQGYVTYMAHTICCHEFILELRVGNTAVSNKC